MTYESALNKIHSLLTFGSRPGLDRMKRLLAEMGNPQDSLKYIHIAGTNGKGSVCAMLSSALVAAGYKTGLFISPYITDFRERIQINNVPVSQSDIVNAVEETFPLIEKLQKEDVIITEFEYVNALEFYIHSKAKCDIVVLETGMGGLLDCTNVIKSPLCSVITTIGLDHTAVLGDTIEKIADQKCGIIKENSLAVTSAQDMRALEVIETTARKLRVPLAKSSNVDLTVISETLEGSTFEYNGETIKINLAGDHQIENAKTALATLEILHYNDLISISPSQIALGFSRAKNPARLELMSKNPVVIIDGAHNPNGIQALKNASEKFLNSVKKIGILGMMSDKDINTSIKLLSKTLDKVITVPIDNPRAISPQALAEKCKACFDDVTAFDNVQKAFDSAYSEAESTNSAVIVCGSLYLAGEIRPYILQKLK